MKRLLLLLAFTVPAPGQDIPLRTAADDPEPLGGFEGEESVIRLVSEAIDVHLGKKEAQVRCRFIFRSGKKSGDAKQIIGFPDLRAGSVSRMEIFIDGEKVDSRKEHGWISPFDGKHSGLGKPSKSADFSDEVQPMDFFVVEADFSPDKEVLIERNYTCASGADVTGAVTFDYTNRNAGPWQGSVAQADFHIILDGFTVDDLAFEDGKQKNPSRSQHSWCMPNRSQWTIVSPTELKLTWKDFEPAVHETRDGIRLATWAKPPVDKK